MTAHPRGRSSEGAGLAPDVRALLETAARIVASRMTDAGHLAQVVTQEHRGNCTVRGCTPGCVEAGGWLVAVDELLLADDENQPVQLRLEAATPARRRREAV